MLTYYQTDPGKVRSHNEDSVTIVKNLNGEYLLVVADGMGGHKAGEIASSLVVNELGKRFMELSSIGTKEEAVIWLKEIIDEININILKYAEEHIDANGLGTTCVCSILTKNFLLFGNVGDSSGFVYKKGKLYKVTKDHTLVSILLESGELTENAAKTHPQKNVLMKALGAAEIIDMDIFDVEREVDGIFLCSDGLTNLLSVEQIEKVLNDVDLDIEEKVNKLIMKSNARGGTDNITVAYLNKSGE
ncbi:MAG: Stp1/IreP family PP2C-type Ser/Thr phosphatase [Tenericutes bacterium]|nr:Stp1/IreP family PP2C-type Ser/Thr phosphatase [Mycoplasmatota bacterium]